jgi:parallel beta-helix repeat protein
MNLNSINRNSIDRNSTSINKTSVLALFLVSVFVVSGLAGVLGVIPIAHASSVTCTTTYTPASPEIGQQWTISSSGTYCLTAGTYSTQITITASGVTLAGAPGTSASQVIIKPSTVAENAVDFDVTQPEVAIIFVTSGVSPVTIEGLTVDGSALTASTWNGLGLKTANSGYATPEFIGILFQGANGTIEGNTITNINYGSGNYAFWGGQGIFVQTPSPYDPQADPQGTSRVIISGNVISNYQLTGVTCNDQGTTCTISTNAVSHLSASDGYSLSAGIMMGFGAVGTVSANAVSGNVCTTSNCGPDMIAQNQGAGIISEYNEAPYSSGKGTVVITGNTITGNDVGVFIVADSSTVVTNTISNKISASTYAGVVVYDESQTVSKNTFSSTPVGVEAVSDTSGIIATVAVSGNTFTSITTPFYTDTANGGIAQFSNAGCGTTYAPGSTPIDQQLAISSSGAYCFEPGTYDTQITITTSGVTLTGAPGVTTSQVIIRPTILTNNSLTPSSSSPTVTPAIIYVGAGTTGVTVEGLTVDGSGAGSTVHSNSENCAIGMPYVGDFGCWFGISFWGASGTIENNVVTNMNNGPLFEYADTPGWGYGILAGSSTGPNSVAISGNTVSYYVENGITCYGTGMTCTISGNTVSTYSPAEVGVISNGIEMVFGAKGSITGNAVSGNACSATALQTTLWNDIEYAPYPASGSPCGPSPYQFSSTGILTQDSSGATISSNTLTGNDVGMYLIGDTGAIAATSNTISHSSYDGIYANGESASVTISGNTISSTLCSAWNPAQDINQPACSSDLVNNYQADGIATSSNTGPITISSNTLKTNDVGIYLYGDLGTNTVASNSISGSTFVGVAVYDESQTVSSNAFLSEPVGIEAVSDGIPSPITVTVTVSGNTFTSITTPYYTDAANGGIALIVDTTVGTLIACGSSNVPLGTPATCDVIVTGNSPTGTVSWTQTGPGVVSFSSTSCTLSSNECSITITGTTLGFVTLTAAYGGDTFNKPSKATSSITVTLGSPPVTVFCNPVSVVVGGATICRAIVLGTPTPTGKVTWSTTGSGKFSSFTCTLHNGACSVKYWATGATTTTITANYLGDKHNAASYGTFSVTVSQATSKVVFVCSRYSMKVGAQVVCRAHVTGYQPTGTVTWSVIGGSGLVSFTSGNTCNLTSHYCKVTITATTAGEVVLQAAYSGDLNNSPGTNTHNLTVRP